ncbi:MAG: hypothetical protein KC912_17095 [Proteobacteria bacterium]|nr:hypothetical protein [Pseudomonadota bacterium]
MTLSEADLHEVVGELNTEDAPTDWAPTEEADRTVLQSLPAQASPDDETAIGGPDLPFSIESKPPPPKRSRAPEPVEFAAPPMLTEEFEYANLADVDRTEEAPKLTMPVRGAAMTGEPQIDLSSLREASAPPAREMGPAPASDFNDEPTRPAYPMEGTLEPADDVGHYMAERERRRQTWVFAAIGAVAIVLIVAATGTISYLRVAAPADGSSTRPGLSEVISSSDGRVAVEVEEPSVADMLPPAPRAKAPAPAPEIKITRTAPRVGPTRVVRAPVPVAVPVTAPAPLSAATPAPAPSSTGFASLLKQGWSSVSGDPASAVISFRSALDRRPGDAEASYGLGYALWRLERQSEALPHLCLALRSGGIDTQREVNGMLARSSLSCD